MCVCVGAACGVLAATRGGVGVGGGGGGGETHAKQRQRLHTAVVLTRSRSGRQKRILRSSSSGSCSRDTPAQEVQKVRTSRTARLTPQSELYLPRSPSSGTSGAAQTAPRRSPCPCRPGAGASGPARPAGPAPRGCTPSPGPRSRSSSACACCSSAPSPGSPGWAAPAGACCGRRRPVISSRALPAIFSQPDAVCAQTLAPNKTTRSRLPGAEGPRARHQRSRPIAPAGTDPQPGYRPRFVPHLDTTSRSQVCSCCGERPDETRVTRTICTYLCRHEAERHTHAYLTLRMGSGLRGCRVCAAFRRGSSPCGLLVRPQPPSLNTPPSAPRAALTTR